MAFVVTDSCIKCKYTDCVSACPVDCFYEGPDFLVIHPDECVDCGACVPECPAEAIFEVSEVPTEWAHFTEINAILAPHLPNIAEQREALPEADHFREVKGKGGLITLPPDIRALVAHLLPAGVYQAAPSRCWPGVREIRRAGRGSAEGLEAAPKVEQRRGGGARAGGWRRQARRPGAAASARRGACGC